MNHAISSQPEGLGVQIEALAAQCASLDAGNEEAFHSVRRIVRSMLASLRLLENSTVLCSVASQLALSPDNELSSLLDRFLLVLHDRAQSENVAGDESIILVVDDDAVIRRAIELRLESPKCCVLGAKNIQDAHELLRQHRISLIILDLILPQSDGRDFLLEIKSDPLTKDIPVVFLSGKSEKETKAECLALGAEMYFEKPFDPDVMAVCVSSILRRVAETKLKAHVDALTGLPNRASFKESFGHAQAFARRANSPLTVAILDLDHFKSVNDNYGHKTGDLVLQHVSSVIKGCLRQSDVFARWGGEEFVALLPDTNLQGASKALEHALDVLKDKPITLADATTLEVTFSAGIAEGNNVSNVEEVIADADKHLYRAKATGRCRVLTVNDDAQVPKKTILLAEDDPVTARIIKHRFQRDEIDVIHVANGAAAYEYLSQHPVSLVLSDYMMPQMDGFQLLKKIRATSKFSDIPFVMLTSLGKEDDVARAFDLGADDYVVKPFSPVELVSRVHRLLRSSRVAT